MNKIKKGDTVIVIAGKDKGKQGKILKILPSTQRVVVEHVNLVKKHVKAIPGKDLPHGILSKEASIHVSNVAIKNTFTGKPDRVGFKMLGGVKKRIYKSNQEIIDEPVVAHE